MNLFLPSSQYFSEADSETNKQRNKQKCVQCDYCEMERKSLRTSPALLWILMRSIKMSNTSLETYLLASQGMNFINIRAIFYSQHRSFVLSNTIYKDVLNIWVNQQRKHQLTVARERNLNKKHELEDPRFVHHPQLYTCTCVHVHV